MDSSIITRVKRKARKLFAGSDIESMLGDAPLTRQAAEAIADHQEPWGLLPWLDFEDGIVVRDNGSQPQFGFGFRFYPVLIAGKDLENQLEAVISRAPDDTVLQFAAHSSPAIDDRIEAWERGRLEGNSMDELRMMARMRTSYLKQAANGPSLLEQESYHPREVRYYLFVTMTFKGDPGNKSEVNEFKRQLNEYKNSVEGYLNAMQLWPQQLGVEETHRLCRQLLNPQIPPSELDKSMNVEGKQWVPKNPGEFRQTCFEKQTRIRPDGSSILFADDNRQVVAAPVTMDFYPEVLRLWMTGELMGAPLGLDRVSQPYWLTTIISKPDQEEIKDKTQIMAGLISKQCMSDSEWYKNMMPHLFSRRDDTMLLLDQTRSSYSMVRMMTGCIVFTSPERVNSDVDFLLATWRKAGFRGSQETYIGFPVWQNMLPWGYNPKLDQANKGLQRGNQCHSLNAACASIVQGDWSGTAYIPNTVDEQHKAQAKGIPLISRRGQLMTVDLFSSSTNYNFAVVATSGGGKSFLANEIVSSILSEPDGIVRIIDVGESYADLCNLLGGHQLRFDAANPFSLNPFWGLSSNRIYSDEEMELFKDKDAEFNDVGTEIDEAFPMLKDLIAQMVFPVQEPGNFEIQLVENAIARGFEKGGDKMETRHVYEALLELGEEYREARQLAVQLEPYAIGRYAAWFNGPPQIDLSARFTILELEELNNDQQLRAVILSLVMAATTKDMYLRSRAIKKMIMVDEAWDLLGNPQAGKFIETAFRRIRKYNGTAGVITQGFGDFAKSPAAQAAFDSCAWKFVLKQSSPSVQYALDNNQLGRNDEAFASMLRGIQPGRGYSEVYVQGENGAGLARFVVDPFTYYYYTTNAVDLTLINDTAKQLGVERLKAIEYLANRELERRGFQPFS